MPSRHAQVHGVRQVLSYARQGVPVAELEPDLDELRGLLPPQIHQLTRQAVDLLVAKTERQGAPESWGEGRREADRLAEGIVSQLDQLAERGRQSRDEAHELADSIAAGTGPIVRGDGSARACESVIVDHNPGPVIARGANDDGATVPWRQW